MKVSKNQVVCALCHLAGLTSGIDWRFWSSGQRGATRASVAARTRDKRSARRPRNASLSATPRSAPFDAADSVAISALLDMELVFGICRCGRCVLRKCPRVLHPEIVTGQIDTESMVSTAANSETPLPHHNATIPPRTPVNRLRLDGQRFGHARASQRQPSLID